MTAYIVVLLVGVLACGREAPQPADTPKPPQAAGQPAVAADTQAPGPPQASGQSRAQATAVAAKREDRNPTVIRALEVIDSLIAHPGSVNTGTAERGLMARQTAWFKTLRDRLSTLLTLVQAPAEKVAVPAPVDSKNLKALQDEAETEAGKFTSLGNALKARHDIAMNAIRNMKA